MAAACISGHFLARFIDPEPAKFSISASLISCSRQSSIHFFHHVSHVFYPQQHVMVMSVYFFVSYKLSFHSLSHTHIYMCMFFNAEISIMFIVHEWLPRRPQSTNRNHWNAHFSNSSITCIGYGHPQLGHFTVKIRSTTIYIWNYSSPGKLLYFV